TRIERDPVRPFIDVSEKTSTNARARKTFLELLECLDPNAFFGAALLLEEFPLVLRTSVSLVRVSVLAHHEVLELWPALLAHRRAPFFLRRRAARLPLRPPYEALRSSVSRGVLLDASIRSMSSCVMIFVISPMAWPSPCISS